MKIFFVKVVETRTVVCTYEVEATNEVEARERAEEGDTIAETTHENTLEVINRTIYSVETE